MGAATSEPVWRSCRSDRDHPVILVDNSLSGVNPDATVRDRSCIGVFAFRVGRFRSCRVIAAVSYLSRIPHELSRPCYAAVVLTTTAGSPPVLLT